MAREYLILFSPFGAALVGMAAVIYFAPMGHRIPEPPDVPRWKCNCQDIDRPSATSIISFEEMKPIASSPFLHDVSAIDTHHERLEEAVPRVSMILRKGGQRLCRINGEIFKSGQRGPGFLVSKIWDDRVELILDSGARKILYLNGISLDSQEG
jgi:hypothetical protein